jgi:hypothetical protein
MLLGSRKKLWVLLGFWGAVAVAGALMVRSLVAGSDVRSSVVANGISLPKSSAGTAKSHLLGQFQRMFTTFGRDSRGELYVGDFGAGDILKLVPPGR